MKCDRCNQPATVHLIDIQNGQKIEKHLCEAHADEAGVTVKVNPPINEILEKYVMKSVGPEAAGAQLRCERCGLTYEMFRKVGLLGCANCYATFEDSLEPLLAKAHEGHTRHIGKIPSHAGTDEFRQQRLVQLRRELEEAVTAEQFERAAQLRDEVKQMEAEKA